MTPLPARHRSRVAVAALLATGGLVGCGSSLRPTSTASLFAAGDPSASVSKAMPQSPRVEDDADPKTADVMPAVQPPAVERAGTPLTPAPASADATPAAQPAAAAASPQAVPAAAAGTGGRAYMIVGGIVAQVNDTPIYAHTVFAHLDRELAAQAKTRDWYDFADYADVAIKRELNELIEDQRLYIEALRTLTDDERKLADVASFQQRERLVKEAGGSAQEAVRKAAADGGDFDQNMEDYHRSVVIELFKERHVWPLVSISAADMLDYYHANVGKLYTRKPSARYRIVKLDPDQMVGAGDPKGTARLKAEQVRYKATRGADFAALASAESTDPYLKKHGGDPNASSDPAKPAAAVGPGTYAVDAVDQAIWALKKPGDVTPVIEADGVFYVAKLEERTAGEVKAFDAPGVQEDIYRKLDRDQRIACQQRFDEAASEYVVPWEHHDARRMLMQMAMQKYAVWSKP